MFLSFMPDADAQRRGTKKRERKEDTSQNSEKSRSSRDRGGDTESISLKDRMNYEISIGNINFNSGFAISLKPAAAFKFNERLSAGAALRSFYIFQNRGFGQDDISLFHYGPSAFGRFKVSNEIYLQAEYNYMSYDAGPNGDRVNEGSPYIGGGYLSGFGPWKFGIQLLFITDDTIRNIENTTLDYWFSFSYNF